MDSPLNVGLVPGSLIADVFDEAWDWLEPATMGRVEKEDLEIVLLNGTFQLWSVANDLKEVKAWAVSQMVVDTDGERTMVIRWAGGSDLKQWIQQIDWAEHFARTHDLSRVAVWGRPGWKKTLAPYGYTLDHCVYSKKVNPRIN